MGGRVFSAPAENIQAIHLGHLEVEEHEVGRRVTEPVLVGAAAVDVVDEFLAVGHAHHSKCRLRTAERPFEKEGIVFVVLRDQQHFG
jgi:hypothetical protein